ncbi:MAG TPA: phenylalanine--tRNA ligase subunit beta [bacterium]|nr:phenylalanine--tRNA ligase subunit beta [bacterium]
MKISWNWLKEFVEIDWTPQQFVDQMMMLGLEVESSESIGAAIEKVIVGQIREIAPHPQAENLVVCQVDAGHGTDLNIVCGAKNMKVGDKVAVATHGTELPSGLTIKKAKLRGITSEGMMCSDRELGLSDEHAGIKILAPDSPIGTPLPKVIGLDDTVLDIKITPNRPDYLSLLGIARDVAAATHKTVKDVHHTLQESDRSAKELSSVQILDGELCARYAARLIRGVKVAPSPDGLKTRLERVGQRSINNVVDATNYVLWELGHPMHAFDMDKLNEQRIVVRRASEGEKIRTLDGVERTLTSEMLVIADARVPVALAGIMGGADSEVSDETTNILLESAYFDPVSTRRTSKQLGISTEASYRFERGADYHAVITALDRCAAMIQRLAGGEIFKDVIDTQAQQDMQLQTPRTVTLRRKRVTHVLGNEIATDDVVQLLTRLGFHLQPIEEDVWSVQVPSFRVDVSQEADLIEEIARLYGYDRIVSTYPRLEVTPLERNTPYHLQRSLSDLMVSAGLQEVVTYSFMAERDLDDLNLPQDSPLRQAFRLTNPLSQEESLIRTTLAPRLLKVYDYNQRRARRDLAIYEIADTCRNNDGTLDEHAKLGILLSGEPSPHWSVPARERDFFDAKGLVMLILNATRARNIRFQKSTSSFLNPERAMDMFFEGIPLGFFGELAPEIAEKMDFLSRVSLIEINLDVLHQAAGEDQRKFVAPSPYPAIERDVAILVPLDAACDLILDAIRKTGKAMLESVVLFDRYRGKQVDADRCSLAFRLVYRSPEKTLTEEEVNARHEKILKMLERDYNAVLRG